MKISISATNPCHLYPLAVELARLGALGVYHSGYPIWKLPGGGALPIHAHSLRTKIVYGALKYLPAWARPETRALFRWQDTGFDRCVGRNLEPCAFIHAMPGQALHTFRKAKALGVQTVLNHATGPVREWVRIMAPEYARIGLRVEDVTPYDARYFAREDEEYALADFHCVASGIVRAQLERLGMARERIWLVPYGADPAVFHPGTAKRAGVFRIVFAGQIGVRKGLRCLLEALEIAGRADWELHFYGGRLPEAEHDLARYRGATPLSFHGPVSQTALAEAFRAGSVLVLPSVEEGFGLVVPQALNCGTPCIVSDRVGAADLIEQRGNGSIFPYADARALAAELTWWEANPDGFSSRTFTWREPAETLLARSR